MIDRAALLSDLQRLVTALEDDLRERCEEHAETARSLQAEHRGAREAGRTAHAFEAWREDLITQAAVAWVLGCVFVRFVEDNRLVDVPRLAGPGPALQRARDEHTHYFQQHPTETDREYLLRVFRDVARLPAMGALYDEAHNPLFRLGLSADGATKLLGFWQRIDPDTGALVHDFTDTAWDTRFLGDLYQDLSAAARKKYALLQTPEFVESFILDRTLDPAIEEFGLAEVTLIDPACGSGHFLLGAFGRLFARWLAAEPGTNPRVLAQRALDAVHGVDLNPFAVSIARFRLLLAALKASGIARLAQAPEFAVHLAAGDSLFHGRRPGRDDRAPFLITEADPLKHVYTAEDEDEIKALLERRYHVVVGNPPYIVPNDAALNQEYRNKYASCYRQYSLGVPFTERFFDLALPPADGNGAAGFVGTITANSFMKREFGKRLIEEFVPGWDLTHVIDSSGAYIPGHGTPTVILFARNRRPVEATVRTVMGIRGEPETPAEPARGKVWTAIVEHVDRPGFAGSLVSVDDVPRERFAQHPWSMGGGGAAELRATLESSCGATLAASVDSIGRTMHTGLDDAFYVPPHVARRWSAGLTTPLVRGEEVRDWNVQPTTEVLTPYDTGWGPLPEELSDPAFRFLWRCKPLLSPRVDFGRSMTERGLPWYVFSMLFEDRVVVPLALTFSNVATHNHFALRRERQLNNSHAPVIKLPPEATEDDHLALLGLLNSSTACFWMKQVFHNKGARGTGGGFVSEEWEQFFEFDGTKIRAFPIPEDSVLPLAKACQQEAERWAALTPESVLARRTFTRDALRVAECDAAASLARLLFLQEELDWRAYQAYGLIDEDLAWQGEAIELAPGERAFEIRLARQVTAGEASGEWFTRHGATPRVDVPGHWPSDYADLVRRRMEVSEEDRDLGLIERPEHKRRWNVTSWADREARALREWLLGRLEAESIWTPAQLASCARLADAVRGDAEFMAVAALYRDRPDFDLARLVTELVEGEAVPFLPALRYKRRGGLPKRQAWERTWDLQRAEDAIDARARLPADDPQHLSADDAAALKRKGVGDIPVPPKYTSADFRHQAYWRLRGRLDVPKERFVLYPGAERDTDPTPVVGWAGWDHLQRAKALAAYYVDMRDTEGWDAPRLTPLLAGLLDLVPWLKQWHDEVDPQFGVGMGRYFDDFVAEELRRHGLTREQLRNWEPPLRGRRRGRGRSQ